MAWVSAQCQNLEELSCLLPLKETGFPWMDSFLASGYIWLDPGSWHLYNIQQLGHKGDTTLPTVLHVQLCSEALVWQNRGGIASAVVCIFSHKRHARLSWFASCCTTVPDISNSHLLLTILTTGKMMMLVMKKMMKTHLFSSAYWCCFTNPSPVNASIASVWPSFSFTWKQSRKETDKVKSVYTLIKALIIKNPIDYKTTHTHTYRYSVPFHSPDWNL